MDSTRWGALAGSHLLPPSPPILWRDPSQSLPAVVAATIPTAAPTSSSATQGRRSGTANSGHDGWHPIPSLSWTTRAEQRRLRSEYSPHWSAFDGRVHRHTIVLSSWRRPPPFSDHGP